MYLLRTLVKHIHQWIALSEVGGFLVGECPQPSMSQLQFAISSTTKTTYTRPDVLKDLPKIIDISFLENKE